MKGNVKGLVSVIIPNHNYGKYISLAIESVMSQTYSRIEIIVVDNGSTDDSRAIIKSYGAKIRCYFQKDLGQAESRNTGLRMAKGEFIAFLDADDLWDKYKIERQLEYISNTEKLVLTQVAVFQNDVSEILRILPIKVQSGFKDAYTKNPNLGIVPAGESCVLLTKDLADRVGFFDNELGSATGRDFFRRCSEHTNFAILSEVLTYYRLHEKNMSQNIEYMLRNSLKAHEKTLLERAHEITYIEMMSSLWVIFWASFKAKLNKRKFFGTLPFLFEYIRIQKRLTHHWLSVRNKMDRLA